MKKSDWQYLVDTFLFLSVVGIALIGFLMGLVIPKGPTAPESTKYFLGLHRHQWSNIHFYLSIAFVVFLIVHHVLSWKWIKNKSQQIFKYLEENADSAYFSKDVFEALKDNGIKMRDVMSTVRRYDKQIYVRGYRSDDRQTPFREGYLLTWIDQTLPREQAIQEAIERTDKALLDRSSTNPVIERVHAIRDRVIESSKLRELVEIARKAKIQSTMGLDARAWRSKTIENIINPTVNSDPVFL